MNPTWRCFAPKREHRYSMDANGNPTEAPAAPQAGAGAGEIALLREKLELLERINALSNPSRTVPTMKVKVPEGSHNMSPSEFRTYKKDCTDYKKLTGSADNQIVLHLRLHMDADLKRIIDTNHSDWDSKSVEEAMNTIEEIVTELSNPVVYRKHFDELYQKKDERIQEYVTELRNVALDCSFFCPYDEAHDLTDYFIINRIRAGIYDKTLQHEILQKHESLNTVNDLVQYCSNFETSKRDKEKLNESSNPSVSAAMKSNSDLSPEEVVAAISAFKKQKQKWGSGRYQNKKQHTRACSSCGYNHGDKPCKAKDEYCLKCSLKGHYSRVCPTNGKSASAVFVNTILGSLKRKGLEKLWVTIGEGFVSNPKGVAVIPDTGAEVTVAGTNLLQELNIGTNALNKVEDHLNHVAGGSINVVGNCFLSIKLNDTECIEQVFFITGTDHAKT